MDEKIKAANEYVKKSWIRAVRKKDADPDFVMPYDCIPPCIEGKKGAFINLFYWDTYFTNKGLLFDGMEKYALGNIEDLKFSLRKFGCVPNMCRANGADYASQPPLLVFMVDDYYEFSKDKKFLADSFENLKIEYEFWMCKRISPTGLNRWGGNFDFSKVTPESVTSYTDERTGKTVEATREEIIKFRADSLAMGESGQDNTQRFLMRTTEINPVDLNSYLYGFEKLMAKFALILGENAKEWTEKAVYRKKLMDEYLFDKESGIYFDYIFTEGKRTGIYCADNYIPYFVGLTTDAVAIEKINGVLIKEHGVVSTAIPSSNGEVYQWGFPNVWAPHQYWAFVANVKANKTETAKEIALKYLSVVANEFEKSGALFEKYDGVIGGKAVVNEYGVPEMLGWTAGVYRFFYENLANASR